MVFLGFVREASRLLRRRFQSFAVSLNGHLLQVQTRFRLLGLIFDRNNRFVGHMDHALANASRAFASLRPMLRSSLITPPIKTNMSNMYKTYVWPVLKYASANVCRGVGSFVFANKSLLYEQAGCPKIARFITEMRSISLIGAWRRALARFAIWFDRVFLGFFRKFVTFGGGTVTADYLFMAIRLIFIQPAMVLDGRCIAPANEAVSFVTMSSHVHRAFCAHWPCRLALVAS